MAVSRNNPTPVTDPGGIGGSSYASRTADNLRALWDTTLGICSVNGGSGGANEVHLDPPFTDGLSAYASPMGGYFKPLLVNTAAVQINVAGLGLRDLVQPDGSPLQPGDLDIRLHHFVFDDAENRAVLLSYKEPVVTPETGSLKKAWSYDLESDHQNTGGTLLTMTVQGEGGDVVVWPSIWVRPIDVVNSNRVTTFRIDFYIDGILTESSPTIPVAYDNSAQSFNILNNFGDDSMAYVLPDNLSHTYEFRVVVTNTLSGGRNSRISMIGLGQLYEIEQAFV